MFDEKNMSKGKVDALEVAEAARETDWSHPSFVANLFQGKFTWNLISPFPFQSASDRKIGDEFVAKVKKILDEKLDADEVNNTGIIPEAVYDGLAAIGAFGIKIPKEYGGLGLSQVNYNRAIGMVASYCASTAVMLSAHQSIGVPQPLKMFGTEEQKKKYLPRFAKKYISAFALTELDVGSDPAKMSTTAVPTEDGKHFIINGTKLWCTNGPIADILIVMAKTPSKVIKGKERTQITAFIVETNVPGFEVLHRCRFMGLNGIQNGLLKFTDVKIPRENIVWGEGAGLKLALTTLNTGRLTVPAATSAGNKYCLSVARDWSGKREQWGAVIGKHEAIAAKISNMAAHTFATEAVTWLVSAMADDGRTDMRLEAAMSKLFCTEVAWRIADDTVQIRGGRGYETSSSLKERGEEGIPCERMLRDMRINLIIEGTSDIMQLFIAREAMDWHLKLAKPLFGKGNIMGKLVGFAKLSFTYALWYPLLWIKPNSVNMTDVPNALKGHLSATERYGRRLARNMFHAMALHKQKLERKQRLLARVVNIGTDLFAIAASISYATTLAKTDKDKGNAVELCDAFCRLARKRVDQEFKDLFKNTDDRDYDIGRNVLSGDYKWLEKGTQRSY